MKWLAPEVVQTSAMDCGPAALTCLLRGHGIEVAYGRLREACQTDVDGTSIDVLETVACQLGLDAEQVLVPVDHVLRTEAKHLPAVAVVVHPDGLTHFVVVWARRGRWVQVMDPAVGRRWMRADAFLASLYRHRMTVPEAAWREWAGSDAARLTFRARLAALGCGAAGEGWLARADADPSWRGLGTLDAALRYAEHLTRAGALHRGAEVTRALAALVGAADAEARIPKSLWTVSAAPPDDDGAPQLLVVGAVLVATRGVLPAEQRAAAKAELPRELAAALDEPRARPWQALVHALAEDGWLGPSTLALTVLVAALMTIVEGLVFRGLVDANRLLTTPAEVWGGWALALVLIAALALLDWRNAALARRLGRHLEMRFRAAFHAKIPRLEDRYFQSRPVSDMAERGHVLHSVRNVPVLGAQLVAAAAGLSATLIGIVWLDPASLWLVIPGAALALLIPLVAHPALAERDLKRRTLGGGLFRLTLDALLGIAAVRTHTAEPAILREHEGLLGDWLAAGLSTQRIAVMVELAQGALGAALAVALVLGHLEREGASGAALLMTWWALQVPVFAQQLALALRQYPGLRNSLLRVIEPLRAPSDEVASVSDAGPSGAAAIAFEDVSVVAAGHTILDGVNLAIAPGEHVAIVGPSGAGKSSLVGLLLGWHRAAKGRVLVDGARLDAAVLARLRRRTAWVDPEVHLWNRSLLDNVRYGVSGVALEHGALAGVMASADLASVVESLPNGLQTDLGEGGAFLSGGQGQRVRLARGELRPEPGLIILDEGLRGLDRDQRRDLLGRARALWRSTTLLCITHDIAETLDFPRVVVIEAGRVREDGDPAALARDASSAFHALLATERENRARLWRSEVWRRVRVADGALRDGADT